MVVYALISLGLLVYAVVDLVSTPAPQVRTLPKWLWAVVVLPPVVGPVSWLLFGRARATPAAPTAPPSRPLAPDDDEDFLRELRRRSADPRDDVA